uniref:Uncharacterized protein n=1 Tax=Rhizophora mucronata TaxID=61149 RepID=A0A2P2NU85_RHIMU
MRGLGALKTSERLLFVLPTND